MNNSAETDSKFREVNKSDFYAVIGPQNVTVSIMPGPYPYTANFIKSNGEVRGRTVGFVPAGKGLPETRYFLPN